MSILVLCAFNRAGFRTVTMASICLTSRINVRALLTSSGRMQLFAAYRAWPATWPLPCAAFPLPGAASSQRLAILRQVEHGDATGAALPAAFVLCWRLAPAAQVMMLGLEVERKLSRPRPHMRTDVFQTTEPHADISPNLHQL